MSNLKTVQEIYEAFGRGDIPAILPYMSDDVRWEDWPANQAQLAGVPYLQSRRGKQGVAEFFGTMALLDVHDTKVLGFLDGGSEVVANFEIEITVKATGKRIRDQELHLWSFDANGKVVRMRHYVDTAKHIQANQPAGR